MIRLHFGCTRASLASLACLCVFDDVTRFPVGDAVGDNDDDDEDGDGTGLLTGGVREKLLFRMLHPATLAADLSHWSCSCIRGELDDRLLLSE